MLLSLWQPEIRRNIITLFGHSIYQTLALAHLIILTDKEIIIIEDDARSAEKKKKRYGGIKRYLPLRNLLSVSCEEKEKGLWGLSLRFAPDSQLDYILENEKGSELLHFKDELEKLIF